ncbi:hypothetical protein Hanom_Chr09g00832781 [Helianthus anomalus]
MKKHTELYCYNIDKSIEEERSNLTRDHEESDAKLKFLVKHLQQVSLPLDVLYGCRDGGGSDGGTTMVVVVTGGFEEGFTV